MFPFTDNINLYPAEGIETDTSCNIDAFAIKARRDCFLKQSKKDFIDVKSLTSDEDSTILYNFWLNPGPNNDDTKIASMLIPGIGNDNLNGIYGLSQNYVEDNITYLKNAFNKEFNKTKELKASLNDKTIGEVDFIISELAKIKFQYTSIELTKLNTVIFKMKIDDTKKLYVSHILGNVDFEKERGVLFSLFINNERAASDVAILSELVEEINRFIKG